MADYKPAFMRMVHHEDPLLTGLVKTDNNGGKVRYGLNSIANPTLEARHYYDVPAAQALVFAEMYYGQWYWEHIRGPLIDDQESAYQIFDFSVTSGAATSCKMAQRAINELSSEPALAVDGVIGPKTMHYLNSVIDHDKFVANFKERRKSFYIALNDPTYEKGWLKRVDS